MILRFQAFLATEGRSGRASHLQHRNCMCCAYTHSLGPFLHRLALYARVTFSEPFFFSELDVRLVFGYCEEIIFGGVFDECGSRDAELSCHPHSLTRRLLSIT